MICRDTKANLTNLLLDPEQAPAGVREHVAQCAGCTEELKALEATMQALDGWSAPDASPFWDARMAVRLRAERQTEPAGFVERLRARLLFGSNLHLRPLAAGALALLLLIGGGAYEGFVNLHPTTAANTSATVRDLQSLDENAQVFQQLNTLDQQDDTDNGSTTASPNM
jgi:hypothetical protein